MLGKENLHAYQTRAVEHIINIPKSALFLDMGLGKTVSTLTAIEELKYDRFDYEGKVLIICPLRVANTVWKQEAKKWSHLKDLTFSIVTGNLKERVAALQKDVDIYVINRENIPWLVQHHGSKWRYNFIVIDESSSFKSATSKRFRALKSRLPKVDRVVLLTGTPATNGYMDLWSQFYLLDGGYRLGRTIGLFRSRYFDSDYMGYSYTLRHGAVKEIQDNLQDLVLSMSADDYLELPDFLPTVLGNKLEGKLLNEYNKFEKQMIIGLEDAEINAMSAAALTNKLLQFCSGNIYDEDKNVHHIHDLKIETLKEIIEDNPDENILVAYNYKHELDALTKAFPEAVVIDKEGKAVDEWNKGNIKILLAHPACIDGDTEVLTEYRGWIKVKEVKITDRVYDGIEFVSHNGSQLSGVKEVINRFGIDMTLDHKFLIENEWKEAKDVSMEDERKGIFKYNGDDTYLSRMCTLQENENDVETKCIKSKQTWRQTLQGVCKRNSTQYDKYSNMENMEGYEGKMFKFFGQKLWRTWDNLRQKMGKLCWVLRGYGSKLFGQFNFRANRCEFELYKRELQMGNHEGTTIKQENFKVCRVQRRKDTPCRTCTNNWSEQMCFNNTIEQRDGGRRGDTRYKELKIWNKNTTKKRFKEVYDLVDCGKRNRFLVRNSKGDMYISHNSAGHGLNLQYGGNVIVWYGFTWSLELYQQFNARLHRQGQKTVVRCFHIAVGEIEEKLMTVLAQKDAVQADLLNSLK